MVPFKKSITVIALMSLLLAYGGPLPLQSQNNPGDPDHQIRLPVVVNGEEIPGQATPTPTAMPVLPNEMEGATQSASRTGSTVLVPVLMYYLDRYFSGIPGQTETEEVIAAALEESELVREQYRRALENYKAMLEETGGVFFDQDTLGAVSNLAEDLNLEVIRGRLYDLGSPLVQLSDSVPAAPSDLEAANASTFEPSVYQIRLTWQDNAGDEAGFLIYRTKYTASGAIQPQLLTSVGPNVVTYTDPLSAPAAVDDRYCYQVVAYKLSTVSLAGQPPEQIKSDASSIACAYYSVGYPPNPEPPQDTDNDGLPDQIDECPTEHGPLATDGCPDVDGDAVPDKDDQCPLQWGPTSGLGPGPFPADGCPFKFKIRWMGMKVLNNSGPYAYPGYSYSSKIGNEGNLSEPSAFQSGEEPYLLFSFVNGMTANGAPHHWTTRWCCGEDVRVKDGLDYEPDQDSRGEENPLALSALRDHGLAVFPYFSNQFAEVDRDLGLAMTITLMERDWDATITAENQADAFSAAFKIGGAVAGAVSTCVGTLGLGCLLAIGGAMKTAAETAYDLSQPGAQVNVKDPDDYMGTDMWYITQYEAVLKTAGNGAYAFWFDMPTTYYKTCFGWEPCPAGSGTPITLRARVYMCLTREGISDSQVKQACAPSQMVLPWPMVAP